MRVIAKRTLVEYASSLAGRRDQKAVRAALAAWYDEVRKAKWQSSSDVKRHIATASIVGAERVVFNVKGNSYRLIASIDYEKGIVWIKWIGTHAEYDDIDVRTVDYGN